MSCEEEKKIKKREGRSPTAATTSGASSLPVCHACALLSVKMTRSAVTGLPPGKQASRPAGRQAARLHLERTDCVKRCSQEALDFCSRSPAPLGLTLPPRHANGKQPLSPFLSPSFFPSCSSSLFLVFSFFFK